MAQNWLSGFYRFAFHNFSGCCNLHRSERSFKKITINILVLSRVAESINFKTGQKQSQFQYSKKHEGISKPVYPKPYNFYSYPGCFRISSILFHYRADNKVLAISVVTFCRNHANFCFFVDKRKREKIQQVLKYIYDRKHAENNDPAGTDCRLFV